jgi:hypothetical protein
MNNNNDNTVSTSWLLTIVTIIANITMQDVATFFVILSASISSGYTVWKWIQGIKNNEKQD